MVATNKGGKENSTDDQINSLPNDDASDASMSTNTLLYETTAATFLLFNFTTLHLFHFLQNKIPYDY